MSTLDENSERWVVPDGWTLDYLPLTDSTNDRAKDAARRGVASRVVVLADEQTAGRGRLDRVWIAPRGSGLLMSLLLREPQSSIDLTRMAAVGVAQAIAQETGLAAQVKWPNDVMLGGRKVCGILAETVVTPQGEATVIGVGLNVNLNLPAPGLPATATSISMELGRRAQRPALLHATLQLIDAYLELPVEVSRQVVFDLWRELLWQRSQRVQLASEGMTIEGIVEDVARDGSLLLRMPGGVLRTVSHGELLLD